MLLTYVQCLVSTPFATFVYQYGQVSSVAWCMIGLGLP